MSEESEEEKKIKDSFKVEVGVGFTSVTLTFKGKTLKEIKPERRGA